MITPEKNVSIAQYTYYKIGGIAREVYFPENEDDLSVILSSLKRSDTPYYVLGGGSNILVGDDYWDGAVIITTNMNEWTAEPDHLSCGAGLLSSRSAEMASWRTFPRNQKEG